MSLEIEIDRQEDTLYFRLGGLMDYSTIEGFEPNIPETVRNVVVDFTNLDFIDSTGIGAILLILHEANDRGADVEFVGLNDRVRELFDTVGVFRIVESLRKRG
jgi:stage II sporulation protein AA (anti-sigma F factor antagonist)